MSGLLVVSHVVLWAAVLLMGFLLLGALRSLELLRWRLDQMEAIAPRRIGREGLAPGRKAPDFTLPAAAGGDVSLRDFAGRKVLLVFTQSGCGPCHAIVPELNRVRDKGEHQVVVVNNGPLDETRRWASEAAARFPVLAQEKWAVSKRYEVYATPFAFVIDEGGSVASQGIAGSRQYLGFVLQGAGRRAEHKEEHPGSEGAEKLEGAGSHSTKEVAHA